MITALIFLDYCIKILFGILALTLIILFVFGISILHKVTPYHFPKSKSIFFDGHSINGTCRVCGKSIIKRSDGKWVLKGKE